MLSVCRNIPDDSFKQIHTLERIKARKLLNKGGNTVIMTFPVPPHVSFALNELATLSSGEFRNRFQPVYQLAYAFVAQKKEAVEIATAVLKELDTVSTRQHARLNVKPKGAREKPWIPDWGIVHRLLYRRVQFHESQAERAELTFGQWTRSIVKHLNWAALKGGNSAWAAVSRSLIFHMNAKQTAELHAVVAQNNDRSLNRTKDEDAIRAMKGLVMRSFKERFGDMLKEMIVVDPKIWTEKRLFLDGGRH
jgi:hypothetical protein